MEEMDHQEHFWADNCLFTNGGNGKRQNAK
ncbi:Uncharacterised protein [Vibrio cholerae]|nr:Uncharacterised protein [Vibrio cholerae]